MPTNQRPQRKRIDGRRRKQSTWTPPVWVLIGVAAFAVRLLYLLEWRHSPLFDHPIVDERYHDLWAQAIASRTHFIDGAYFRAPLYPWLLGLIYRLFGHDYLVPRLLQALMDSVSCCLLYAIGNRCFGRRVGAVAGFVAATYWILLYFGAELLIEPLLVFLDLVLIAALLHSQDRGSGRWWAASGAVLGLSAIARPNILVFGIAIVAWICTLYRKDPARAARTAAMMVAGCLLIIAPVTIRNYRAGHEFVPIASQGGLNLWIGNNPQSDGRTARVPLDFTGASYAEQELGRPLTPGEVDRYYARQAWAYMRGHPARVFELTLLKFRLWWSRFEIGNDENVYFWSRRFAPIVRYLPVRFSLVGPLAILGLALCWRRRRDLFPLWGFVMSYMASFIPFFANARFRLPVVPVLILLATWAGFAAADALKRRRWPAVGKGAAMVALGAVLVNVTPHQEPGDRDFISQVTLGNLYGDEGKPADALACYRAALAIAPWDLQAASGLGDVLTQLNRLPEGTDAFRKALQDARPRRAGDTDELIASLESNLANALAQEGQLADAIPHYRGAIRLNPRGGKGSDQLNLGLILDRSGQSPEALECFRQSVAVNPEFLPGQIALARAATRAGLLAEARSAYEAAVRLAPGDPRIGAEAQAAIGSAIPSER